MSILVTKLSALFPIVPVDEAPPFKLPTTSNAWQTVSWMIRPDQEPILLTAASSKSAKIKPPPAAILSLIPTRHLNLPDDFYSDPDAPSNSAPTDILNTSFLGMVSSFSSCFSAPTPYNTCSNSETPSQDASFAAPMKLCLATIQADSANPPVLLSKKRRRTALRNAQAIRQIWLQRNDHTFRVDLTSKAPMEIAIHAACLVKLHLAQLLQVLPLKKGYVKVFNLLKQLSRDPWLKQHLIPDAVQD
ncbi:Aste57867_19481 [Aphanomyces stellatus]|uniref:Aste57867_19481 protein n=1 Tax=Aphanomyces stellatus TaxID=120398 RepID=A0A485LEL7_9STRA|nr:hypothetical protein As57867_019417 [Aphanomyces stellatus]VFT96192.1 Aste57867_19481 [Aphanomyces stellatus]